MAALDSIDFDLDWDNKEDVDAFLESCRIEEDTQSQSEPPEKRPSDWPRLKKHTRSGYFSSKKNPFIRDIARVMMHEHVGAIIVADCHSAAYIGTSLNAFLGPHSKNYFLLGQSNNTYSYVFDGTADVFSDQMLRGLSRLHVPLDTLPALQVILPHFNKVKQDSIAILEEISVQHKKPLDADMHAYISSKQLFATNIDTPYVTALERDGEPGVPELDKYIKLKYLDPRCTCTFGIDENFFDKGNPKWNSGSVLNTVTLHPGMVTILIMFGCSRNIDGGHDAFQRHTVPSDAFSALRRLPPATKLVVPQVEGYKPKRKRTRKNYVRQKARR